MNMDSSSMDGHNRFKAIDIAHMAMLTAILFLQEELLTFAPNIQLTVFLLVLYSKKLGFIRTSIILTIHVILDNFVMGSFSLFYTPAMLVGWLFIPIIFCTLMKKIENPIILGLVAVICSFLYCWMFIIPNIIFYNINPIVYLASDIIFEIILAVCSFTTVAILYKPCSLLFDKMNITRTNIYNKN